MAKSWSERELNKCAEVNKGFKASLRFPCPWDDLLNTTPFQILWLSLIVWIYKIEQRSPIQQETDSELGLKILAKFRSAEQ